VWQHDGVMVEMRYRGWITLVSGAACLVAVRGGLELAARDPYAGPDRLEKLAAYVSAKVIATVYTIVCITRT
jgi:hypothetical protein